MDYSAIILAAGKGSRTGLDINKVLIEINGKKVLDYSVDFFKNDDKCSDIVLVCSEIDYNFLYSTYKDIVNSIVVGGSSRQESVYIGLDKAVNDFVLVHDSARPFINPECIKKLLINVVETKATTLAVSPKDSIVKVTDNRLGEALDRNELLIVQTPQAFLKELLLEAHKKAIKSQFLGTDDTMLIAKFTTVTPSFVLGDYRSVKLTTKEDIEILKVIL